MDGRLARGMARSVFRNMGFAHSRGQDTVGGIPPARAVDA